jgi:predicted dehydrogenase
MIKKAVDNGKSIITTKPLAPSVQEANEIIDIVGDRQFGVIYCRTGNAVVETLKSIFDSGEIGKMAFYKQDWIHHYPAWNNWALDPEKNGGPFMDAMIHNLNIARYLSSGNIKSATLFSDNLAHPDLKCSDTDFMKVSFDDNSAAYLFITWAADLAVYNTDGNDREHIDITYMVTDQGWRVTEEKRDGNTVIVASKDGNEKHYPIQWSENTVYDRYADALTNNTGIPKDMAMVEEAAMDIKIICDTSVMSGTKISF